jgi:hypothetical protein
MAGPGGESMKINKDSTDAVGKGVHLKTPVVSVVAVLGLFRGSSLLDSMMFVLVFIFFGFIFVGWAAMLLGAFTGWLFKQHTKSHSNNSLVPTPKTTRNVS